MIKLSSVKSYFEIVSKLRGIKTSVNMSGPVEISIRSKLSDKLKPTHLDIINDSSRHNVQPGAESHFTIVVVSYEFENKPLIQRHRMVHDLLTDELNDGLHALSIVAKTPSQWADSDKKMLHSYECVDLSSPKGGDFNMKSSLIVQQVKLILDQNFYSPRHTIQKSVAVDKNNHIDMDSNPVMKLLAPELRDQLIPPLTSLLKSSSDSSVNKQPNCDEDAVDNCNIMENCGAPYKTVVEVNNPITVTNIIVEGKSEPVAEEITVTNIIVEGKSEPGAEEENILEEENGEKQGYSYLKVLKSQITELETIASKCAEELEGCESEEGKGELRSIAGKARLLISEKLNQFHGLCQKNISNSKADGFPTTNEDLAGFWDMVLIQIDDIRKQYDKVKILKENHWKIPAKKRVVKPFTNKQGNKKNTAPAAVESLRVRDINLRKLMLKKKEAMKQEAKSSALNKPDTLFAV